MPRPTIRSLQDELARIQVQLALEQDHSAELAHHLVCTRTALLTARESRARAVRLYKAREAQALAVAAQGRAAAAYDISKRLHAQRTSRGSVPVFEWDPAIPGDYARASSLAKEACGRVQRVQR